jgi:hypothetical protein
VLVTVVGVLTRADDGSWWVGEQQVDFGDESYLSTPALADFDGVDGIEANIDELQTLLTQQVTVGLEEGSQLVHELNETIYR